MKLFLLLLLCGTGLCSVIRRDKWHVYDSRTWLEGQAYCRSQGSELLTVVTQSDIDNAYMDPYYAWIGLRLYGKEWKWTDGKKANNGDFVDDEPDANEDCGQAGYNLNKAVGDFCEQRNFFICHHEEDNYHIYNFYIESKSWDDAFRFCLDTSQDLAIFDNWSNYPKDVKIDFPVWTGLYHDGESWKWSDGEYSDFWKWGPGFESGSEMLLNKTMFVHNCSEVFPYLCYTHNVILVKENMTWEEALEECKVVSSSHSHQLLSVEQSELLFANSKAIDAQTNKIWLGLRFLGGTWFWSNGQTVSLPGLPSCPKSILGCGALLVDKTSNGSMPQPTVELTDCSERLNLLCYKL
ncbi:hypothetical protein WMY93_012175 [Mugilogobius chulae]|uniref:C-type lectin domain-containing protein n=1 Tax=Mugilogobius chulae TaxID=88201 RepID=A0AAW0P8D3_9GOBI